ncbi:MAG: ABC-F family ATP-binding cassette domain-containing protein [Flavobacteriales bacterium]|nr:ABC-F family ATP-binding cassette domain-containing protein [Flavobacteriales bacterium]
MLSANNIAVVFSGETLFSGVSFKINKGDRIGLAGKNGAGKTTLMKVLSGDLRPDEGALSYDGDVKVGILRQDIDFEDRHTLLGEIESSFTEIKRIEKRLAEVNRELETRTDYQSDSYTRLIEELNDLTHKFDLAGGYTFAGDIERILMGLGFDREDFDKDTSLFSGGWRMRIELAKLLLQKNDILLLDEPTNHLDIESIIWLEDFLNKFPGGVVLVSHDRTFLDNVTNRTIEISGGRIYDYKQPYSKFLELRQEIREKQIATRKNQENEIKQTKQLIERFRYKATKAAFAQSLMKRLEKTELIEVDTDDVAAMNLKFQVDSPTGKVVFRAENVCKTFDDTYRKIDRDGREIEVKYEPKQVLRGINLEVERGDKIAFVGKNGQGKTTFVRCLLGQINYQGTIEKGHNVHLGYYAQNQKESLDLEKTLIQTIEDEATEAMRPKARDLLGSFLFSGDAIDKKVKVLSGGERGRIALCKLLVRPFNVLLMDEPTNHLDIRSKAILKEALKSFDGTLILVSHDRDFLNGLTNKVYEFRGGYAKEYLGDINFYLEQRKVDSFREMELERTDEKTASVRQSPASKGQPKKENLSFAEKKELEKEVRRLTNKVSKLEGEIEETERLITSMDQLFAEAGYTHSDEDFVKYQELKRSLDEKMTAWEQAQEELSSAQGRL